MLVTSALPRVFSFEMNKEHYTLEDPNPSWNPEDVLNFYTPHYPILATATVHKPVTKQDKIVILFSPSIGDKG
jgi:PRTRC genetic system protein C